MIRARRECFLGASGNRVHRTCRPHTITTKRATARWTTLKSIGISSAATEIEKVIDQLAHEDEGCVQVDAGLFRYSSSFEYEMNSTHGLTHHNRVLL
jgi:hypothetical protein